MCSERGEAIEMLEDRLEDADAKVARLEAENLNLRQELHEPDSPRGKSYRSEVGRLTMEIARLEVMLSRAVGFAKHRDCGRPTCPSVVCREARAIVEWYESEARASFSVRSDSAVPLGEVWMKNDKGEVLCRFINVGVGDASEGKSG